MEGEELARWLQEAGRRTARAPAQASQPERCEHNIRAVKPAGSFWHRALLLGLLFVAAMQYVYADTMLQIMSIPSIIVFVAG